MSVGHTEIFSLWVDFFNFPLFMYAFPDGQRFLCIYDDDTDVLVFVVDLNPGAALARFSDIWPSDNYLRELLSRRATQVVSRTAGHVRLPRQAEVLEASSNLLSQSSGQFREEAFPSGDLGFHRFYWSKEDLLSELATNRTNVW